MVTLKGEFPILNDFPPVKATKTFTGKESFDAVNAAREYAKKLGYNIGSMCSDAPIALAKGMDYIAKWYNIDRSEWPRIQGLLLSEDFRDGKVTFVEF